MEGLAVGLDLGGSHVRAALIDRRGRVLERVEVATAATSGADVVIEQLIDVARAAMSGVESERVLGVGLSAPGPMDTEEGISYSMPMIAGFEDVPLREILGRRMQLPVWIENDAVAAALGEWRFGSGKGLRNLVYITISTGLGGGVVVDNRLLRGRRGLAGEVGHMTIVRNGELCACGNRGCWEAYASGTAFIERARQRAAAQPHSLLAKVRAPLHGKAVFEAAAEGDSLAMELVAEEAEFLGIGIVNLLHLYSPDVVIAGGGMSANLQVLLPGISAKMREAAMRGFEDVPVVRADLGRNSGLIGAAVLAFDGLAASTSRNRRTPSGRSTGVSMPRYTEQS